MRYIVATLLSVLFICPALFAQETFAPLLTENTVAVVRVDFAELSPKNIQTFAVKSGTNFLDALGFDERSQSETLNELKAELDKIIKQAQEPFDVLTKQLGITEIAIISDAELIQNQIPFFIAVPWKNTPENTQKLNDLVKGVYRLVEGDNEPFPDGEPLDDVPVCGDFLLIPMGPELTDECFNTLKNWWDSARKPAANARIVQAMKALPKDDVQIAVALPENIRQLAPIVAAQSGLPPETMGILLLALQKIDWANTSFNFLKEESSNVFLTIKMTSNNDAVQIRAMLDLFIDFGMNMAQIAAEQESQKQGGPTLPPVLFTFLKGLCRSFLPDVEGDKLIFRNRINFKELDMSLAAPAFIGIQTALILPAIQAARESARRMQCTNNLKMIGISLHNYHDVYGNFPPLYTVDKDGKPLHSWRVLMLPFMEQSALYEKIRLDEPWDSEYNSQFHARMPAVFACPSEPTRGCAYSAIAGEVFVPAKKAGSRTGKSMYDITDGTSYTLAIVELKKPFCWMDPTADVALNELVAFGINKGRVGSYHSGGCNVGMFDGSVRFVGDSIDTTVLRALGTCAGGEKVSP